MLRIACRTLDKAIKSGDGVGCCRGYPGIYNGKKLGANRKYLMLVGFNIVEK